MGVFGERLQSSGQEGSGSVRVGESVKEKGCIVEVNLRVLGELLDEGLEEVVCFLDCCQ